MHQILFSFPSSWVLTFLTVAQFAVLAFCVAVVGFAAVKHAKYDWATLATGLAVVVAIHLLRPRIAANLTPIIPVYSYGVMLVVGFFGGMLVAKALARHSGIDPEVFATAGLIALVTGVAGARLSHVLENLKDYTNPHYTLWENLWNAVNIRSGGLTFYGGFLLATPCTILYGVVKKVPIKTGMDIVAPCLMIGLGFGRIGCFLNGCCYGAECQKSQVPWAISFPYYSNPYLAEFYRDNGEHLDHRPDNRLIARHDGKDVLKSPADVRAEGLDKVSGTESSDALQPAQIYSTITAWLIAAVLIAYYTIPHVPGRVFAMMVIIEAPTRYILEMLRAEPAVIGRGSDPPHLTFLPPQSFSMVMSFFLVAIGIILWFAFRGPREVPGDPEFRRASAVVPAR